MERRIGEQFECEGVTLEVVEDTDRCLCGDCYFLEKMCIEFIDKIGQCSYTRIDKREVYFKEVKK